MLKKIKKFLIDFDRAIVLSLNPGARARMSETPKSHKRSLSLGSNESGGKSANKRKDDKTTPVKMSVNNPKGPGKGPGPGNGSNPGPSGLLPPGNGSNPGPSGQLPPSAAASGSTENNVPSLDKAAIMMLPTYAQKAKEGEKATTNAQFPWALYAFGEDGKSPISGRTFWTFQRYANQKWCELPIVERKWINIEFYDYSDTFGVIAALDRYTALWIKSLATYWTPEEPLQKIKCFNRWERMETHVYNTFLRGPNWRREKSGSQFLMTCLEEAGLESFTFTNLKWEIKSRGVYLAFEPEPQLAAELDKTMSLHYYGVCIRLRKQKRKAVTEKEWMEQLGYKEDLKGVDEAAKAEEERLLASDNEQEDDEEMA